MGIDSVLLEEIYRRFNRRKYIHPDPLEFVYRYEGARDREVVGFIASALAYGRVKQILRSVSKVLDIMGPCPHEFIRNGSLGLFQNRLGDFRHRFTTGEQLAGLLEGIRRVLKRHGSLESCFRKHFRRSHTSVLPALTRMSGELSEEMSFGGCMLLPVPERGSACKRLQLYLRWMVRHDAVDPGVWESIPASKLIVPLDTHMHRIALRMGLTERKQADMRTAVEVTRAFGRMAPEDPVKYDFVLTRFGISNHQDFEEIELERRF